MRVAKTLMYIACPMYTDSCKNIWMFGGKLVRCLVMAMTFTAAFEEGDPSRMRVRKRNLQQFLYSNKHCPFVRFLTKKQQGYFGDKYLDTMFIVMTHNSLALPGKVLSPNQSFSLARQFNDGVRGFNLDLYHDGNDIYTHHGWESWRYNPRDQVEDLLQELLKQVEPQFLLVQLEDHMDSTRAREFLAWWGNTLITNFDSGVPLGYYLDRGQHVLVVTDRTSNVDESVGMHSTFDLIDENAFRWTDCYLGSDAVPDLAYRRGPYGKTGRSGRYGKLMNSFCQPIPGIGDLLASSAANSKRRVLYNARQYSKQEYSEGKVNVINVDFFQLDGGGGDVFAAQSSIRAGDLSDGCWADGSLCSDGDTCWNCCDEFTWQSSLDSMVCGRGGVGADCAGTFPGQEMECYVKGGVALCEKDSGGKNIGNDCWPEIVPCSDFGKFRSVYGKCGTDRQGGDRCKTSCCSHQTTRCKETCEQEFFQSLCISRCEHDHGCLG